MDALPASAAGLLRRCRFPALGSPLPCAVSGGADSLALLLLATAAGCVVEAIHVDHGLRPGSVAEGDLVATVAAGCGATFRAVRVAVPPGPNLEARARAARYGALPADVCTGHTADDQAETVLLNLLRGSGLDGLAGIRPRPGGVRRPIIALRRAETRDLCRAAGIEAVQDPSNDDRRHRRNQVRHDLLPLLDRIAERDVAAVIARQADLLHDDATLLDELAAGIDPTDARALAAAPPVLTRRAVRRWIGGEHPPDAATVERVLGVARGDATACDLGGGRSVRRHRQRLTLIGPPAASAGEAANR